MRVAAIQMTAKPGDFSYNMQQAESLAKEAFCAGSKWVVLPEFFTSSMAYVPQMSDAVRPLDGEPMELLKRLALDYDGVVGGSYLARRGADVFNTFVLAFPNGYVYFHDKDIPTMWENCYYTGGSDPGVMSTPAGQIGVALCWEFIRNQTFSRLANKVDLVVGGSCWWSLPKGRLGSLLGENLKETMDQMAKNAPCRLSSKLKVPVIHAAHAGFFSGGLPLIPGFVYESHHVGHALITNNQGEILAHMDAQDGAGFIFADLEIEHAATDVKDEGDGFWMHHVPAPIRAVWAYQNRHGRLYYEAGKKMAEIASKMA